jgi:hypothetical protein
MIHMYTLDVDGPKRFCVDSALANAKQPSNHPTPHHQIVPHPPSLDSYRIKFTGNLIIQKRVSNLNHDYLATAQGLHYIALIKLQRIHGCGGGGEYTLEYVQLYVYTVHITYDGVH